MVMVRARAGGTGEQFNLGQMTVTRCALKLAGGHATPSCVGLGYVQGRSKRHAELAAVVDSLLQDQGRRPALEQGVIAPTHAAKAPSTDAPSRRDARTTHGRAAG